MNYRKIVGGLGVAVVLASIATDGFQGETTYISGTGWQVSKAMDPLNLALSPLAAFVIVLSWRLPARPRSGEPARWFLVFPTFGLDFLLFALALAPPIYLIELWIEAAAVGEFHWSYARSFTRSTDIVSTIIGAIPILVYWVFYGLTPWSRRETPGSLCTGVAFEATVPVPTWKQVMLAPIKIVATTSQRGAKLFDNYGGFDVRAIR